MCVNSYLKRPIRYTSKASLTALPPGDLQCGSALWAADRALRPLRVCGLRNKGFRRGRGLAGRCLHAIAYVYKRAFE